MSVIKTSQLMLYKEIIAVCSEIHTKHINTLCGQNVELLNVKLAVHIVTTGLQRVILYHRIFSSCYVTTTCRLSLWMGSYSYMEGICKYI